MARAHFSDVAIDRTGQWLDRAIVTVFLRGSSTLATIYATEDALTQMDNPLTIEDGVVSLWADAGAYTVRIEDASIPPRVQTREVGWGAVPGITGGIPGTLIENLGITEGKLADLSVGSTKIKGLAVQDGHIQGVGASKISGTLAASQIPSLDAGKITTGTFATARIPTITASMVAADVATQAELDAVASTRATPGFVIAMGG